MNHDVWNEEQLADLTEKLEKAIYGDHLANIWDGIALPGREAVAKVLDRMLSVLFPGILGNCQVQERELKSFLKENLKSIGITLQSFLEMALSHRASIDGVTKQGIRDRAASASLEMLKGLPGIRSILWTDLEAAYEGDPAAGNIVEVLMSYPCVEAIATHRIAHELYKLEIPILPRMMSEVAHSRTGIDIHPGAFIGPGFFIDHGTGVVIGETAVLGKGVKLYQGVTLGALSFPKDRDGKPIKGIKRHPNLEDNVTIYAGATVLGGETIIGQGSTIGGNCWITRSIPPNSLVLSEQSRRREKRIPER